MTAKRLSKELTSAMEAYNVTVETHNKHAIELKATGEAIQAAKQLHLEPLLKEFEEFQKGIQARSDALIEEHMKPLQDKFKELETQVSDDRAAFLKAQEVLHKAVVGA